MFEMVFCNHHASAQALANLDWIQRRKSKQSKLSRWVVAFLLWEHSFIASCRHFLGASSWMFVCLIVWVFACFFVCLFALLCLFVYCTFGMSGKYCVSCPANFYFRRNLEQWWKCSKSFISNIIWIYSHWLHWRRKNGCMITNFKGKSSLYFFSGHFSKFVVHDKNEH